MTPVGKGILELRERAGISRPQLAKAAGVSIEYLRRLEGGDIQKPSVEYLSRIARALSMSIQDLLIIGLGGIQYLDDDPTQTIRVDAQEHDIRRFAPNTPVEEAEEVLDAFDRLDAAGRKAALSMLMGLLSARITIPRKSKTLDESRADYQEEASEG